MNNIELVQIKMSPKALTVYSEHGGLFRYATEESAAVDLRVLENAVLEPGEYKAFNLGIAMFMGDNNMAAMILPRSGLGARKGLVLRNTVGLIDADYTGDLIATLVNTGDEAITIEVGDRVVQLMFTPIVKPHFMVVKDLPKTVRGAGGHGSTGLK